MLIEFEPTEGTISGRLSVEGLPATEFYGWLELINRLERVGRPAPEEPRPQD